MRKIPEECRGEPKTLVHQIIKIYMRIGHLHRGILDKEVRRTGVYRSQHQILMFLAKNSDASQKDIASFLGVSTATIAVTLKKLEKAGHIRRVVDPEDNRCNRIQLTKKGEAVVTQSHEIFYRVEEEMFEGFSEEEKEQLIKYFERICCNLEAVDQRLSDRKEKEAVNESHERENRDRSRGGRGKQPEDAEGGRE